MLQMQRHKNEHISAGIYINVYAGAGDDRVLVCGHLRLLKNIGRKSIFFHGMVEVLNVVYLKV